MVYIHNELNVHYTIIITLHPYTQCGLHVVVPQKWGKRAENIFFFCFRLTYKFTDRVRMNFELVDSGCVYTNLSNGLRARLQFHALPSGHLQCEITRRFYKLGAPAGRKSNHSFSIRI